MQISGQIFPVYKPALADLKMPMPRTPLMPRRFEINIRFGRVSKAGQILSMLADGWKVLCGAEIRVDCGKCCTTDDLCQPQSWLDQDELAVEAIREVGHNGHFFGCDDQAQSRYKSTFTARFCPDWSNYESWEEAGAVWTHDRANKHYNKF